MNRQYRRDIWFRRKRRLIMFACDAWGVADFLVVGHFLLSFHPVMGLVIGAAVFLGPAVLGLYLRARALRQYRCPICRSHIGIDATVYYPGTICFYCPNCDVQWDTGISSYEPDNG